MRKIYFIFSMILLSPMAIAEPISITPSISVLNFPHPLDLGFEVDFEDLIGLKVSKSLQPSYSKDNMDGKINDFNIQARGYPFRGGWFIGAAFGSHSFSGHKRESVNGFDTDFYADGRSNYFYPSTGYKLIFNGGFTLGFEIGWIFPQDGTGSVRTSQDNNPLVYSDPDYQRYHRDAESTVRNYSNRGLPSIGLLELGWTF